MRRETKGGGGLWLTAAQAWHALSGYAIFVLAQRWLGPAAYGDFGLVIWTMTTAEILMVDGLPKALSFHVARNPGQGRLLARRGLLDTVVVGAGLGAGLAFLAAPLASFLGDAALVTPLRLAATDLLVFVGFAVSVQVVNGLRRFRRQALAWSIYSTVKAGAVLGLLWQEPTVQSGVLGYVLASAAGSIVALGLLEALLRKEAVAGGGATVGALPSRRRLAAFGLPVAGQALLLMALVNADLWAARRVAPEEAVLLGAFTAAATLARALFFIFRALGEALFPALASALHAGRLAEARRVARKALAQLLALLLPATGLGVGAAAGVLDALFVDLAWPGAPEALRWLLLGAAGFTIAAVLVQALSASGRPREAFVLLGLVALLEGALLFGGLLERPEEVGVAMAACGGTAALLAALALVRHLGPVWPLGATLASGGAALGVAAVMEAYAQEGILLFVQGGVVYAAALVLLLGLGRLERRLRRR